MRCYGHIFNVVAHAFLYREGFEELEAEPQAFNLLGRHKEGPTALEKEGAYGKTSKCGDVHKIINHNRAEGCPKQ
jgi:hypothetical protein